MPYTYGDSLTGANGALLQAHTPDSTTPFAWVRHPLSNRDIELFSGRLFVDDPSSAQWAFYTTALAPMEGVPSRLKFKVTVTADAINEGDASIGVYALTDLNTWTGYGVEVSCWGNLGPLPEITVNVVRKVNGVTDNFEFGDFFDTTIGDHTVELERLPDGTWQAYWDGVLATTMTPFGSEFAPPFLGLGVYVEPGTPDTAVHGMEITEIGDPTGVVPVEECYPDTSEPVADPVAAALACLTSATAPAFHNVNPPYQIVLDDSCEPVGTLEPFVSGDEWIVGDGQLLGSSGLLVG